MAGHSAPALAQNCDGDLEWDRNDGVAPDCLPKGTPYRILFVTDRTDTDAGVDTINSRVRGQAPGPLSGRDFRVMASFRNISLKDNTGTNSGGERIFWYQGRKVADNYADLYDGSWDSNEPRDRNGGIFDPSAVVATGSDRNGVPDQTSDTCCLVGDGVMAGGRPATSGQELAGSPLTGGSGSLFDHHFYALSERLTVPNLRPLVVAGGPQSVTSGATVTLSGSALDGDDGDTLTYAWTQTSGMPMVALTNANTQTASFTAPEVEFPVDLVFTLQVSDGEDTVTDTVTITVSPTSLHLLAPPPNLTFSVGESVNVFLPSAGGGVRPYTFTILTAGRQPLAGGATAPAGLALNTVNGVLSGTPTTVHPRTTYNYRVTDTNGATSDGDFTFEVEPGNLDLTGFAYRPMRLPRNLSPPTPLGPSGLPAGSDLSYSTETTDVCTVDNPKSGELTLVGPGTCTITLMVEATNYNDATATATVTVTPDLTVAAPGDVAATVGVALTPVTLPEATGGTPPYTYEIQNADRSSLPGGATAPAGLAFDSATRTLSGTPTTAQASTGYRYAMTDSDGFGRFGEFNIAVGRGTQTLTGFAYSPASVPQNGTPPTPTAPAGAQSGSTLSYSTATPGVCTADPGTGALTLVGQGTCTVTVTASATADYNEATATAEVTVTAPLTVSIAPAGAEEGGAVSFGVTLSGTPNEQVTVDWAASIESGDTAEADDFTADGGTLTFASGATGADLTQSFTVATAEDSRVEDDETFTITLSNPVRLDLATATATGTIRNDDSATVGFESTAASGAEGGDVSFTVTLSAVVEAAVAVNYATAPGSGAGGAAQSDFTNTSGTLAFPAGATGNALRRTVDVPALDDDFPEGAETFSVTLTASGLPSGVTLGPAEATGTIAANDATTISVADAGADEGGAVTFQVRLPVTPGVEVRVNWAASRESGDTAEADDFTAGSGTLAFAADAAGAALTQTFTVATAEDSRVEEDETFTVTLSEAPGSPLPPGIGLDPAGTTAAGTIRNDDSTTVGFAAATASGAEGGDVSFEVRLTNPSESAVTVDYATAPGSGAGGAAQSDFTDTSGTLTFPAGTTTQTIDVPAAMDDLAEGDETFTMTLSAPVGATLGAATATGTIEASDEATVDVVSVRQGAEGGDSARFEVRLSGPPGAEVRLDWAPSALPGDTASPGADFDDMLGGTLTFAAGATGTALTQTVEVPATDDTLAEGSETFTVAVVASAGGPPPGVTLTREPLTATGTIAASDAATVSVEAGSGDEGGGVSFTATLSGPPGADVALPWTAQTGSGDTAVRADLAATVTGTVTFASGATGAGLTQTITVATAEDAIAEGDETFTLALDGAGFPGGVTLATQEATGTIRDNEMATVSVADAVGHEGGNVSFEVTLTHSPGTAVMVNYATSVEAGDTAETPADFAATSGTLTFAAGTSALTQMIDVPAVADGLAEGPETFTVTLSSLSGPPAVALGDATATGTIEAGQPATLSVADASGAEGEPVVFTVALSASPAAAVTVEVAASVGTGDTASADDFAAARETLTFAAATTELMRSFAVETVADERNEGDETFTVTVSADPGAPLPPGVTLDPGEATARGIIRDDAETAATALADRLNEAVLPHVAQAVVAGSLSAIVGRIDAAANGSPSLAGKPDPLQALRASERALREGATDLERVLGGASFVMPLNAAEGGGAPGTGGVAVWGSGDHRSLSGPDGGSIEWDGEMFSLHLGADVRVRPGLLAGVSVSRSSGSFDYTDRSDPVAATGTYDSRMTGVHPYVSWSPADGTGLWATAGYGQGEIRIREDGGAGRSSDTEMVSAAAGASRTLLSDDGAIPGGTATLKLKGEGSLARIEVEGGELVRPAEFDVRRLRMSLEGSYECLAGGLGGCLAPSVEIGVRHDGGDARAGNGVEVGGGLRYTDRGAGLTIEGRGRALVLAGDGYEDWGVGALVRVDPGADGRGLSVVLTPSFGDAAGAVGRLYDHDALEPADGGDAPAGRLELEIGYGLGGPAGLVTPYTGLSLADGGPRSYRMGARLELGPGLSLGLEGRISESGAAAADHGIMVRGRLHW